MSLKTPFPSSSSWLLEWCPLVRHPWANLFVFFFLLLILTFVTELYNCWVVFAFPVKFAFLVFCSAFDAELWTELGTRACSSYSTTSLTDSIVTVLPFGPWIIKSGMFLNSLKENKTGKLQVHVCIQAVQAY